MNISSDLEEAMTEVRRKLVNRKLNVLLLRKYQTYLLPNRMRNIHRFIESEYGKEKVQTFRRWERLEYKMADFENHRRFTLRCLSKDVIPVSVRLKTTIKTTKGRYIIKKAERALLNERVRNINNSLTMFKAQ